MFSLKDPFNRQPLNMSMVEPLPDLRARYLFITLNLKHIVLMFYIYLTLNSFVELTNGLSRKDFVIKWLM